MDNSTKANGTTAAAAVRRVSCIAFARVHAEPKTPTAIYGSFGKTQITPPGRGASSVIAIISYLLSPSRRYTKVHGIPCRGVFNS